MGKWVVWCDVMWEHSSWNLFVFKWTRLIFFDRDSLPRWWKWENFYRTWGRNFINNIGQSRNVRPSSNHRQSNFKRNHKLQCNKWTKVEALPHNSYTTFGEKFIRWKLFHSILTCSPFFRSSQFVVQVLCVFSLLHPPKRKQLWDFLTIISNHELRKKSFPFHQPKQHNAREISIKRN